MLSTSEPKRPVRPSSGPDGTDGVPERTGILASVRKTVRDGRAGTTGVLGGGICREPPRDDGWALKVTGPEVPPGNWRRQRVTAGGRGVGLGLLTSEAMT